MYLGMYAYVDRRDLVITAGLRRHAFDRYSIAQFTLGRIPPVRFEYSTRHSDAAESIEIRSNAGKTAWTSERRYGSVRHKIVVDNQSLSFLSVNLVRFQPSALHLAMLPIVGMVFSLPSLVRTVRIAR